MSNSCNVYKKNSKEKGDRDLTTELCPMCLKPKKDHSLKEIVFCALNFIDSTRVNEP